MTRDACYWKQITHFLSLIAKLPWTLCFAARCGSRLKFSLVFGLFSHLSARKFQIMFIRELCNIVADIYATRFKSTMNRTAFISCERTIPVQNTEFSSVSAKNNELRETLNENQKRNIDFEMEYNLTTTDQSIPSNRTRFAMKSDSICRFTVIFLFLVILYSHQLIGRWSSIRFSNCVYLRAYRRGCKSC